MARTVGIGNQDFYTIRKNDYFYIDKTDFIREWWENGDSATLITRPRRFGKTLNMSMTEQFFSIRYKDCREIFEGLSIWQHEKYRMLQGAYPVISLSFASVKEDCYENTRRKICQLLANLYSEHEYLLESSILTEQERDFWSRVSADMGDVEASLALYQLSACLMRYYGKKAIILLDEYDTPMQEAYIHGYWDELVLFVRNIFNAAFKTNPYMERALLTGITRISKESIFSDLNNLEVVTATSVKYRECFGFTQKEVTEALKEYGVEGKMETVKDWYDGFSFGNLPDIYNPWSILNYLDKGIFSTYWANTSSNSLIGKLIRGGSPHVKTIMEDLMNGKEFSTQLDEQVVFEQLDYNENAIWSLLLAGGYLKVSAYHSNEDTGKEEYVLALTNKEVRLTFERMIEGWFSQHTQDYNGFIKALLRDDLKAMNVYMNRVALATFSFFDTGNHPSESAEPERFYHGFVLGLMVELRERYRVTSNRESGFGRYDVMLEPKEKKDDAMIFEFKVFDPDEEATLHDTVKRALEQIEEKNYVSALEAMGIPSDRIRKYGFAFQGKNVMIGK